MTSINVFLKEIQSELSRVLSTVNDTQTQNFIPEIISSNKIVTIGAGRVGLAMRAFAMRLAHLGMNAHMWGDATVPSIAKGDTLIVASGSGETQTVYDIVEIAKKNHSKILLITANPDSRMGKLADSILILKAPSKIKPLDNFISIQPMTTLNEQSLFILLDALVLHLMEKMGETHDSMWARHSNLE